MIWKKWMTLEQTIETAFRDQEEEEARLRMLWPNSNPSEEVEKAWERWKEAYGNKLFNGNVPTIVGGDWTWNDEEAYRWEQYKKAVQREKDSLT